VSLAGYLSEYSLSEIFRFVQEGHKTGLLWIEADRSTMLTVNSSYYISFQSGRIVSITNGLKNQSLIEMIEQRKWLSPEWMPIIEAQLDDLVQPLGTQLKVYNLVSSDRLKLLFNSQVISNISKIFKIQQGRFKFNPKTPLAYSEMTGLSLTATEGALLGLRVLQDWSGLTAKLPAADSALQRLSLQAGLRLDSQEWQIWQVALGDLSISKIAKNLGLSVEKVQQIGFRLTSCGLVQEVSIEPKQPSIDNINLPTQTGVGSGNPSAPISASFLSNLMGFLKKKG
jgi:Domain of unknown function (DUF4388)